MIGGASNPVGGINPAGTGSNINYVGNHAYVYSGAVNVNNVETTLIDCTIAGNQYIMAKLQILNGTSSNEDMLYKVKIDNTIVMQFTFNQATTAMFTSDEPLHLLLAPQSKLVVTGQNQSSATNRVHTATLTGRVYA